MGRPRFQPPRKDVLSEKGLAEACLHEVASLDILLHSQLHLTRSSVLPDQPRRARAVCGLAADCSFIERANCKGCCWRRPTTSFQSSRSCFTRSNCDSMCCCEIWRSRNTLWSAFLAIMSKMFRKRCEQR